MYFYSAASQDKLDTCHSDLIRLFNEVIKHRNCTIICGRRGKTEQDKAYADGKSKLKYPSSYHNRYPSRAIDVAPYFQEKPHIRWNDIDSFREFGGFVLGVAAVLNIQLVWGGHWKMLDYPHYQIKGG